MPMRPASPNNHQITASVAKIHHPCNGANLLENPHNQPNPAKPWQKSNATLRNHTVIFIHYTNSMKPIHSILVKHKPSAPPPAHIDAEAEAKRLNLLPSSFTPLSSNERETRLNHFNDASKNREKNDKTPWNGNEQTFAANVAKEFLNAFHRYDAMSALLQHRRNTLPRIEDSAAREKETEVLKADIVLVGQLHRIATYLISHNAITTLTNQGYSPSNAKGFLGGIIHQSIHAHHVATGSKAFVSLNKELPCAHVSWTRRINTELETYAQRIAERASSPTEQGRI